MTQIVIVCYKPKEGKTETLKALVKEHVPILLKEQLVTDRKPIIMEARDGTIVEVFEWVSDKAVENAHSNPAVLALWARFEAACEYVAPTSVPEFQHIFSGFRAVD